MSFFRFKISLIAFLLIYCNAVIGQLHCLNYTSQDGLPSDHVAVGVEDQLGYMWFGTAQGVCRFDGVVFQNYSEIGTGDLPGSVEVRCLEVDEKNNIWLGSMDSGIFKFDQRNKHWVNYPDIPSGKSSIFLQEVNAIRADKNGQIWFSGKNVGLGLIDQRKDTITHYLFDTLPNRRSWKNLAHDIEIHPQESNLLYLAAQGHVITFDKTTKTFDQLPEKEPVVFASGASFTPSSLELLPDGRIFTTGWNGGLFEYDSDEQRYIGVNPPQFKDEAFWRAKVFKSDATNLWASFRQLGIGKYNTNEKSWSFFEPEAFNRDGLLKGEYIGLTQSRDESTWVLTSNGISQIVPAYQAFDYMEQEKGGANFFLDSYFHQPTQSYFLAFAGNNAPLKIYDKNFKVQQEHFLSTKEWQSVFRMYPNKDDLYLVSDLWYKYNFDQQKIEQVKIKNAEDYRGRHLLAFDEDDWGWILLGDHSLRHYNLTSGESRQHLFKSHQSDTGEKIIYKDLASNGDFLWIAALTELIVFDKGNFSAQHFYFDEKGFSLLENPQSPAADFLNVAQVLPQGNNQALVLTESFGLFLLEYLPEQKELQIIKRVDESNFSALRKLYEIVPGNKNDFWIATGNGLVHADKALTSFVSYAKREGLKDGPLMQGLSIVENTLFIGMPKGLAKVETEKLLTPLPIINCHIDLATLNEQAILKQDSGNFPHQFNKFQVEISAPTFRASSSLQFARRLKNLNESWQYSDFRQRNFIYEQLDPGDYEFEVKAKTQSVDWGPISSVKFTITRPWWSAWWFRILCLLMAALSIWMLYLWQLKRATKDTELKRKMAELENQALRTQMNPHFIFNSLNSIKSLVLLDRKEEGVNYLTQFSRMVREILSLSKETTITLKKELELLRIYLEMESLRFTQKFEYSIEIDSNVNIYEQKIPPLLIQPYTENAIWHGLLHKEGDAHLLIKIAVQGGFLNIIVQDDGIGRASAEQQKSSRTFYGKKYQGTQITNDRLKLLNGRASVIIEDLFENNQAQGTRVTIKIPTDDGAEN